MKSRDLINLLLRNGFIFDRNGGNHEIYYRKIDGRREAIGRHKEIPENIANKIIKRNNLK